jgi:hypothetical protein
MHKDIFIACQRTKMAYIHWINDEEKDNSS